MGYADSMRILDSLPVLAVVVASAVPSHAAPTIAVCAPGYPSSTEEAQPVMDDFARAVTAAAGASPNLVAAYHPTLDGGLALLEDESTTLAIVPLPFYLRYRARFGLEAELEVVAGVADRETWSLVARRGAISSPGSLAGWKLEAIAGYAPTFVRRVTLEDWGELPEDVDIGFSSRVLSALRKAARGENLAVLLDTGQAEALERLPFAEDLEIVARSAPMLGTLLCRVAGRQGGPDEMSLRKGLLEFGGTDEGRTLLKTMRLSGFRELDRKALAQLERLYESSPAPRP